MAKLGESYVNFIHISEPKWEWERDHNSTLGWLNRLRRYLAVNTNWPLDRQEEYVKRVAGRSYMPHPTWSPAHAAGTV